MWHAPCSATAPSSERQATTAAVNSRRTISPARFGPATTATRERSAPGTSAMTSLIRRRVPSSIPFMRLTSSAPGGSSGAHCARLARSVCAGTANATRSAPSSASRASEEASSAGVSAIPGR